MAKRFVIALGGNAILTKDATATAQQAAILATARQLTTIYKLEPTAQVIITHGNGPQVGNLLLQQQNGSTTETPPMPLDTVGAMTQGQIGYWLANALDQAFNEERVKQIVATMITRTEVAAEDNAFQSATKPIGPFYSTLSAKRLHREHPTWQLMDDAGRGYRRIVASPKPIKIIEAPIIKDLMIARVTIIAAGGGIPVVKSETGHYRGVEAVIDKDFSAAKLAELVDTDVLIMLTGVENVYLNYQKRHQHGIGHMNVTEMQKHLQQHQFAAGSMQPKVEAAIEFVQKTGHTAVITSLNNLYGYLETGTGTVITSN